MKEATEIFDYRCNEDSCKGKFSDIVKQVSKSAKIEAKGVREVSTTIIQELENIPTASTTAGFLIQSAGKTIIHIKNSAFPSPKDDDNVGFIDVTEVRRRFINELLIQREQRQNFQSALFGGLVSTTVVLGVLKVMKKI
jgi:hypothetical protein